MPLTFNITTAIVHFNDKKKHYHEKNVLGKKMADLTNLKSSFPKQSFALGLDIGSVAASAVEMSLEGEVLRTYYAFHHGNIYKTLCSLLEGIEFPLLRGAACTSTSPHLLNGVFRCDSRIASINAAKHNHQKVGSLLSVGGEKFSLITFDNEGNYRNLKTNTSCAAGTGSFLDQQARRLNLSGSAELSRLALLNKNIPPIIASRCSVFAKTDIVHAQQTGYSLEEICDGVCKGLADNIADILLSDEEIPDPIVFVGGVSRNKAVVKHLEKRIGKTLLIDEWSHIYDAAGAGLALLHEIKDNGEEILFSAGTFKALDDLVIKTEEKKGFFYEPLSLKLSQNNYPEFDSEERYLYPSDHIGSANPVETDIYVSLIKGKTYRVYLGIDIGSTSTKGVLLDSTHQGVLAGFYTRTAGRPIKAVQAILETIEDMTVRKKVTLDVVGVGATGSGRKFAGEVIGADLILDEITAHARAAYELNPKTDTIIEIGGQDSKFTTMRNGLVTFSQMNTVCAAGTGSFLEEQAEKLEVPLSEFSARAEGVCAPLVSDRCTVFMERDINRFLNKKYSIDELLAASLFAVRENYLLKVATEGNIGSHICFQGATAKNKALVAAFEQKLQKPIYVSKYCHLTGALGVALILKDEKFHHSHFRGIDIHKEEIPVRTETCELCRNHCRIRVAAVKNEEVAYGFLCGRDYNTHKFIDKNKSGFDLLKEREKVFHIDQGPHASSSSAEGPFTIGLPAALYLFEDLPFWKFFFKELSLPVVSSEGFTGAVKLGKKLAGAEFCAPMNAIHGHARYLSDKADCLFLPIYLDQWHDPHIADKDRVRHFCYYTQFSSSVISRLEQDEKGIPCMMSLLGDGKGSLFLKRELYKSINETVPQRLSFMAIFHAYDKALAFFHERKNRLKEIFREKEKESREGDIRVVLVGRPYTILSPAMNKGIPGIFASLGIKTYFQDMLPVPGDEEMEGEIGPLLDACHWWFAAQILEAAHFAANCHGLYPVYITSFRCAPDSFTIEYFKRILEAKGKPYLILQLDEHDSNVGYETRIEAGVRSFRNHSASIAAVPPVSPAAVKAHLPFNPGLENDLTGKTVLFPNWESITSPLLVANLQAAGIDARLLEEDETTVRESMRMNTGQCIPLNAMVLESIRCITRHNLDPARTVLWMGKSTCSCNIGMYPYYIKSLFEAHGKGMEKVGVYIGDISHIEISPLVAIHTYLAYLFGGLIRKLGCQIRPYELEKGETDKATAAAIEIFKQAFRNRQNQSYLEAIEEALALFSRIRFLKTSRPKVAIFGDLYMRDNVIMNQDLIHDIEDAGGEVLTTPYNEYLKIISSAQFKKWFKQGQILKLLTFRPLLSVVEFLEKKYFVHFKRFIQDPLVSGNEEYTEIFSRFNMRLEQGGESWDNILKIFHILKAHPDISLFVQTNPAFCCPALITEAQSRDIQRITGVPIVTLTYDGTGTPINDRIIPYLRYPRKVN
jgi:predicted CoA-substrate-specific enzyme activase